MACRTHTPAWLYAVGVAVAVVGVIALTLSDGEPPRQFNHEQDTTRHPTSVSSHPEPIDKSPVASRPSSAELTPADVMGNPDCIMKPGEGHGRDMAMVLVPGDDGTRFAVVDGSGIVFGDTLPFYSTYSTDYPSLARRPDGSVLAGFGQGSNHVGQRHFVGVVVFQDGSVIYERRTASQFDRALDGSSFYVVEPMAGDVSRLVIRNLDLGLETHHDLGTLTTGDLGVVRYSVDQSEVVIQTPGFLGWGDRSVQFGFFPTDGSEPRQLLMNVTRRGGGGAVQARGRAKFVSSNEGYFGLWRGDDLATVKREFSYDGGEVLVEDRWSRDLSISPVSADGVWLVGHGETGFHVLDTSGNSVFELPRSSGDFMRIHDGRLVLDHEVGDANEIARCRGKRKVAKRTQDDDPDGTGTTRSLVDVTGVRTCLADLQVRGLYSRVYDVYDLRTLADGGSPDHYRVEFGASPHCGSGEDPFGTLEVRDAQLVYVPRT